MAIRKTSKEELKDQVKGFLDYVEKYRTSSYGKKTIDEISEILGLKEPEKRGFYEWLSKKFGKELDISDKGEIEKTLKKKHINFDKLWKHYEMYLKLKGKEKRIGKIKEKVKIFFEPYKTPYDEVNERMIDVIVENYSKDTLEKARIFFTSSLYEFACKGAIKNETFFKDFMECVDDSDDLRFLLSSFSCDELFEARISKCIKNINISVLKRSVFILNKYEFNYKEIGIKDLESFNITTFESNILALKENGYDYKKLSVDDLEYIDVLEYIKILKDCNVEGFVEDFGMDNEDYEDLSNLILKFKYTKKDDLLSMLVKIGINKVNKILGKCPDIRYENNGGYRTKTVHMFPNINEMRDFISDNKDEYGRHDNIEETDKFLYYIWIMYWTNNWKKNINLVFEKGLIDSKEIVDDMYGGNNKEIAHLKTIKNEILEKLLKNGVSDENFNIFVMDLDVFNYEILTVLLEKWSDITIKDLNSMKKMLTSHNLKCLKMILDKRDNITMEELIGLEDTIGLSYEGNLKIIFEKYPSIVIGEIKHIKNLLEEGSYELLKIIFEKYPNISYEELQVLKLKWFGYVDRPELGFNITNLCECIKILFEFYPDITIKQLSSINLKATQDINYGYKRGTLSWFLKYFSPVELMDLNKYEKLLSAYLSGLVLEFKEVNKQGYVKYIEEINDTYYDSSKKKDMIKKICALTFNEAENYLKIFKMFDESISMDIKRIRNELIDEILKSDNPKEVAKSINNIFEKNNLPLTGKIFKVFELLYPIDKFRSILKPHGSPVLHQFLDEGKNVYSLIYKDLMNIAIKSGDRSLKQYINTFIGSENLIKNFEEIVSEDGFNRQDGQCLEGKISEDEQEKLLYLFRRISVVYSRYFGKKITEGDGIEDVELGKYNIHDDKLIQLYNDIKKGFHLKKGESIYDRLQRFLYGLGYRSFQEVLNKMNNSKKDAHEKGLKLYNESIGGKIIFPKYVFLKGVYGDAFQKIVNRGVTCREYLGGGENGDAAGSDATPFDIDGIYVDSPIVWTEYGNINLVINATKGNIYDTKKEGVQGYTEDKYELFETSGGNHYGIRTGIPMTEVDYIIYHGDFGKKEFQDMCYEIARNGYYVPITDSDGNIKFTPEMYHKIRLGFNYMKYYDGFDVEFKDGKYESKESDNRVHRNNGNDDMIRLIEENSPQNEKYKSFAKENKELAESTIKWIKQILEEKCGIKFNSKYDSSITGAELHDSGSTGRGTDIPTKDVDLDFTLILDAKDYERVAEIARVIHEEIGTQKDSDHGVVEGGNQIKSKVNNIGKSEERPNGIPLDLLILKKSQVIDYSSSDAMKEKLEYIASNPNSGAEDLDRVRTNVIIMKKLLKAKGCYKKPEGGISGIGVENRIIQNHGSFIEALESFEQVAYGGEYEEGKEPKSLTEFQKLYPIYDAGENYKDGCNDNFVYKLQENGYKGTLEIVKTYRLEGMNGIRRLIAEYEQKKVDYI